VQFELARNSDLQTPGGEIAVVNGSAEDSFAGLLLSNEAVALPVEMAEFEAQASGSETVRLRWETVSETNNTRFEVQRLVGTAGGVGSSGAVCDSGGDDLGSRIQSGTARDAAAL